MANDFENIFDIENLNDSELRELVYQQLREYPEIDPDQVDVQVTAGRVQLSGRVGTEQEWQQIEHVITDVIGLSEVENGMVIDELVRGEMPEAADEARAQEIMADPQMGSGARRGEDSAKHLVADTAAELYGTHDPQQATEEGLSYSPPDRPTQEGTQSRENH